MAHSITLIISGSIAAIKAPELIRKLKAKKIGVRCIVTQGGSEFVSVKEIEKLSGHPVSTDLFSPKEKKEMWHIRFSRETDLIVVAPASANLIAKMAGGLVDDMASATLLANNKKLIVAPAMNTYMWIHPATQRNVKQIVTDGAIIIEPREGMLACGEVGQGRMAEPGEIVEVILASLPRAGGGSRAQRGGGGESTYSITDLTHPHPAFGHPPPVRGREFTALVTSGPTFEAIDPVRFIGNRSSGKQGHAVAKALAAAGAKVTLVTGPTAQPDPQGINVIHVTSAREMLDACEKALPVDVAVCAAAVADWRVAEPSARKIKKRANSSAPVLELVENPDVLAAIATAKKRPKLVIGFAAETENLITAAKEKRLKKRIDWVVANDVSANKGFDADENQVTLVTGKSAEEWPLMSKDAVAEKLVERIISSLRGA